LSLVAGTTGGVQYSSAAKWHCVISATSWQKTNFAVDKCYLSRCWSQTELGAELRKKEGKNLGVIQMRYYFHVLGVGRTYKDDEGMACKNTEHAKGHAQFMAYELFRLLGEEFRSDQRVTAISVLVTDEMGNEITRAPLRLGCRWLH
jgi:hypothetical protein